MIYKDKYMSTMAAQAQEAAQMNWGESHPVFKDSSTKLWGSPFKEGHKKTNPSIDNPSDWFLKVKGVLRLAQSAINLDRAGFLLEQLSVTTYLSNPLT